MKQREYLDYLREHGGIEAVMSFMLPLFSADTGVVHSAEQPESTPRKEIVKSKRSRNNSDASDRATLRKLKALFDAGNPVYLRRVSDGELATVIGFDGEEVLFEESISDGKGRSSNRRSRHSVLNDWRLVQ